MKPGNYRSDQNPYGLPAPPAWFLAQLATFDAALLIFPSRMARTYRLARRVPDAPGIFYVTNPDTDTQVYWAEHAVPVCSIAPDMNWSLVIGQLTAQHIPRLGGADRVADALEQREADRSAKLRRDAHDEGTAVCGSAWNSFASQTGRQAWIHNPAADLKLATGVVVTDKRRLKPEDVGVSLDGTITRTSPVIALSAPTVAGCDRIGSDAVQESRS